MSIVVDNRRLEVKKIHKRVPVCRKVGRYSPLPFLYCAELIAKCPSVVLFSVFRPSNDSQTIPAPKQLFLRLGLYRAVVKQQHKACTRKLLAPKVSIDICDLTSQKRSHTRTRPFNISYFFSLCPIKLTALHVCK